MSTTRRDFMKMFGVTVASLLLTRCRWGEVPVPIATCYAPLPPPSPTPGTPSSVRERLRLCWLRFGELASKASAEGSGEDIFGQQLVAEHRAALDELVADGEISAPVADLVQEAYGAAVYHVWRSNAPITCYEPMIVDYAPTSAGTLVQQAEALDQIAAQGTVDPDTLASIRAALEHDMAFYTLSDQDVEDLYNRLISESREQGRPIPSFDALQLELTPEAKAAAQFIVDLLTGK
jgi:hypothetical protein